MSTVTALWLLLCKSRLICSIRKRGSWTCEFSLLLLLRSKSHFSAHLTHGSIGGSLRFPFYPRTIISSLSLSAAFHSPLTASRSQIELQVWYFNAKLGLWAPPTGRKYWKYLSPRALTVILKTQKIDFELFSCCTLGFLQFRSRREDTHAAVSYLMTRPRPFKWGSWYALEICVFLQCIHCLIFDMTWQWMYRRWRKIE